MRKLGSPLLFGLALVLATSTLAQATGTARVQQSTGKVRYYYNVVIDVTTHSLRLTSADGKGTLIINRAACAYDGYLQKCTPQSVYLKQNGATRPIDIKSGTVWVNLTKSDHTMSLSSTTLPPRGILMTMETRIGTYVTLNGKIDGMKR
jgi:hypothetical protein